MNENYPSNVLKSAQKIKLLLLDVDGVLTDGRLYYGNSGEELKAFDIQDGLGIKLLQSAGIKVGIITGRKKDSGGLSHKRRKLAVKKTKQAVRKNCLIIDRMPTVIPAYPERLKLIRQLL